MLTKLKAFIVYYRLPILSGFLIGTSYIPFPPWALFFAFVPLWLHWLREDSWRRVLIAGWVTQFVLTIIGFNWVSYTISEFGHFPWVLAIPVFLVYAAFANLHVVLAGAFWGLFRFRWKVAPWALVALLPAFTALSEQIYPMIFDWHFGYTWLYARLPAFHLADIFGFQGLSTISIFLNLLVLVAWMQRHQGWKIAARPLIGLIFIFAGLNLWGWQKSQNLPEPDDTARVLIVQANIGNLEKQYAEWGMGYRRQILNTYLKLTTEGLKQSGETPPDFIVWPETAFPEQLNQPVTQNLYVRRLREFVDARDVPLVTGAYSQLEETHQPTNSLFVLDGDGQNADSPYHKTLLLAFGEYVPGAQYFPKIKKWLPQVADFGRGPGPSVQNLGEFKLGPQICYEGLFAWFSRSLANKGADILVNVTNDSWYGHWQQPFQHVYMTLARGIEVRRPVIRSTNTGITTAILADGTILEQSPLQEEWHHLYEVPYKKSHPPTLFQGIGFWMAPAWILMWILMTLGKAWSEKSRKS